MLFDWFAREGWIVFNWWLLITIAGITVLPLVVRLLDGLPDRGYTLARPAGMLLIAFVFWLLVILGFVRNSPGGIALAWLIVLALSLATYFSTRERFDWRSWWSENRPVVIATELLFAVLLVGWAVVRAHQNDMTGTEQPMDLAFLSASLRSETFPPNDPWLAGYAISYYYFGYVMGAMLSMLSGVVSTIGYNMHIASLFALAGITAFGVTYNLIRSRAYRSNEDIRETYAPDQAPARQTAILVGLLGMVFVILLSNFHTVLVEFPYRAQAVSEDYLRFWDAKDRDVYRQSVEATNPLDPSQLDHWWWFAAARTITERNLDGVRVNEVIDEFPMFSFLLADSHPHVMALPYALLAMGLALNVLLSARKNSAQVLFYGICVGALIFLNTWDAPIYITLLVGADGVQRLLRRGRLVLMDWLQMLAFGVALLVIGVVAYSPFLMGFQSQLAGVLPNLLHPTRFQQLFVMFGPFILILIFFLGLETWRARRDGYFNLKLGAQAAGGVLVLLLMSVTALLIAGRLVPEIWAFAQQFVADNGGWDRVIGGVITRRILPLRLLTLIVLLAGIALVVARLFPHITRREDEANVRVVAYPPATGFALLLVGVGLLLVLIPEFLYLRDNFGTRMNTVFKLYYQAWAAFSIASAYGVYTLLADARLARPAFPVRVAFSGMLVIILLVGAIYPVYGIYHRMFVETNRVTALQPIPPTLNGGPRFVALDDYEVIMCLHGLVGRADVVVAEAEQDTYRAYYGRVGSLTGIPVVANWLGHQTQWRGRGYSEAVGSRRQDLRMLYTDPRFDMVLPIIERYNIDYILYGVTERRDFGSAGEEKFQEYLEVVCESGSSRIYRVGYRVNQVFDRRVG